VRVCPAAGDRGTGRVFVVSVVEQSRARWRLEETCRCRSEKSIFPFRVARPIAKEDYCGCTSLLILINQHHQCLCIAQSTSHPPSYSTYGGLYCEFHACCAKMPPTPAERSLYLNPLVPESVRHNTTVSHHRSLLRTQPLTSSVDSLTNTIPQLHPSGRRSRHSRPRVAMGLPLLLRLTVLHLGLNTFRVSEKLTRRIFCRQWDQC
jgi:hypothetical protein